MDKKLTWRELKALYQLYSTGKSKAKIKTHPYVKNVLIKQKGFFEEQFGRKDTLVVSENNKIKFKQFYKSKFLKNYKSYHDFLEQLGEKTGDSKRIINYSRLTEYEIKRLLEIQKGWDEKRLQHIKQQIEEARENRDGVSAMFFKSPKYIKYSPNRQSIETAVKALLGIEQFHDHDKQYLYVLHCKSQKPRAIILCENLHFLKLPVFAHEYDLELWYAGGNNIAKLNNVPEIKYPIFYLCDWDYAGLQIYERVKNRIDNLVHNQFEIKLITPNANSKSIEETEEHHRSEWENSEFELCGLDTSVYEKAQIQLIQNLITKNHWIEEEDNNFENLINIQVFEK